MCMGCHDLWQHNHMGLLCVWAAMTFDSITTWRLLRVTSLQHKKERTYAFLSHRRYTTCEPPRSYEAPNSFWHSPRVDWKNGSCVFLAFHHTDLTDTGLLSITSRHYGYTSTETRNSSASSRRRRRFLCDSHSLPILHRNPRHGIIYQTININS